jgi:hypothetical protein
LGLATWSTPAMAAHLPAVYPCRTSELPPDAREPNPTVRDAVVKFENGEMDAPDLIAQACIVVATDQNLRPAGNYPVPPPGLWFDWNLALVGKNGALIDTFGTLAKTGPVTAGGSQPVSQSLTAAWRLGADQPMPVADKLFAQILVEPCTNLSSDCGHDTGQQSYITLLLPRFRADARVSDDVGGSPKSERNCLAPMKPGDEYKLRQLTVVAHDGAYRVFACLVSDQFDLFKSAGFSVTLHAKDMSPAGIGQDGNTRENIGPIFPHSPRLPRVVALLAVDIPAAAPNASPPTPVKTAHTIVAFVGCAQLICKQEYKDLGEIPVKFEHAGQ